MPDLGNETIQVERFHAAVPNKMLREIFKVHRLQGKEDGSVFFDAHTIAFDQFARWEVGVTLPSITSTGADCVTNTMPSVEAGT
jgi:hypothetical protein